MNLLILDTETTGLDINNGAQTIEVGAILYNVENKCILQQYSSLRSVQENPVYDINKISQEASNLISGEMLLASDQMFINMREHCDAIVAHNAEFDKKFIHSVFDKSNHPWICTKNDFKWPIPRKSSLSLINIAVSLGVPITSAHRALTDCSLLVESFNKLDDLKERLNDALHERFDYKAHLDYESRHLAIEKEFKWDATKKLWTKRLTEKEASLLDFCVSRIP